MKSPRSLIIYFTLFLVACQGITLDVNESNTFDPLTQSSYTWATSAIQKSSAEYDKVFLLDSVFRQELNAQLADKGYQLTGTDNADFVVSYRYFTQVSLNNETTASRTIAENSRWVTTVRFDDMENNTPSPVEKALETGSLEVIFSDQSGKVIWQAAVSKAIQSQYADKNQYERVVKRSLSRMFRHLPDKGEE